MKTLTSPQKYTPANGSLSEQFNNQTGVPLSAYDLTWSFASFVTMARRRAGIFPPSWGFSSGDPAPKTCSSSSYNSTGSYIPAIGAGAPTVDTSCASEVLFTVNATTQFVRSNSFQRRGVVLTGSAGREHISRWQHNSPWRRNQQPGRGDPPHESWKLHFSSTRMVHRHLSASQHISRVSVHQPSIEWLVVVQREPHC